MDIIKKASRLCDKLIIAVLINENKVPIFSLKERLNFLERVLVDFVNIEISSFSGLLVDFLKEKHAVAIIRGLRTVSDFEYEYNLAHINKTLSPDIETLFLLSNINCSFVSSSAVREIARYGGDIGGLVPCCIKDDIHKKLRGRNNGNSCVT